MEQFTAKLVSIEELYKNEFDGEDKGKNFFIPKYQRDFVWNFLDIEKLIKDIYDMLQLREGNYFQTYFIGGIVLCRDSMLGPDRSKISYEVIDGQQRLTSISLILAVLYQQLSFSNRIYGTKDKFVIPLIKRVYELIKYERMDNATYEVKERFKVERSDEISSLYESLIDNLLSGTVKSFSIFKKKIEEEKELISYRNKKTLIDITSKINKLFNSYSEDELIDFTLQLLEHTKVVVTKTLDTDTGFLVFEKLNDNGKQLNPDDLLKNFLFSKASDEEYSKLEEDWKVFLNEIASINKSQTRTTPREFLDQYLISKGKKFSKSKNKIFTIFKEDIFGTEQFTSIDLLTDLKKTAIEYGSLKRDEVISKYLYLLNFKLGYLIFLSLYKKFNYELYEQNKYRILSEIFRLGFVYILTDNSKQLSNIIPEICKSIQDNKEYDIEKVILKLHNSITKYIEKVSIEFDEYLSNSTIFTKRQQYIFLLLNIINFQKYNYRLNEKKFSLVQILPNPKKYEDFNFDEFKNITIDNINKYSNYLGNLIFVKYPDEMEIEENDFKKRVSLLKENNKLIILPNIFSDISYELWGKESIEKRSSFLTEEAKKIFINGELNIDFFTDKTAPYFYIEKDIDKNAIMVPLEENKCKVLKGSTIRDNDLEQYTKTKNELISSKKIIKEKDYFILQEDFIFNSPSEAASIITGRNSAGPITWKNSNNETLKETPV